MAMYIHFFEIEPVEVGQVYTPLPLHCTLMGWFSTDAPLTELENLTREICSRQKPFEMVSAEPALFGPNCDLPVFTLRPNSTFMALHLELLAHLEGIGAKQKQPSYAGPNYRMHVTTKGERSFSTGSNKTATRVVLAEVIDNQTPAQYRICSVFPLG